MMETETRKERTDLRPLFDAILSIYDEFQKVCDRRNLRYWAEAGTLLGAVRHKGFIPWDDDMDVAMPQKDWDEFNRIADKELPSWCRLVNKANTPGLPFRFAKLQDSRPEVSEKVAKLTGHPQNEGVFLDVFALTGVPDNQDSLANRIYEALLRTRKNVVGGVVSRTWRSKIGSILGHLSAPFFRRQRTFADYEALVESRARAIDFETAEIVGLYDIGSCTFAETERRPRAAYDKTVLLDFEGRKIPAPADYHACLAARKFGDYMQLPPEEDRCWKHRKEPAAPWKYGPVAEGGLA